MMRLLVAAMCVAAVLAGSTMPAGADTAPAAPQTAAEARSAAAATRLGMAVLRGEWVASGVVWLDWDDVEGATGYELMCRSTDGWALLSENGPVGGVAAAFEGSGARVAGLPTDAHTTPTGVY